VGVAGIAAGFAADAAFSPNQDAATMVAWM
jgi:hypothetical protein